MIKTFVLIAVALIIAFSPAVSAQALTAEKAQIALWQEVFSADYVLATDTIAMTLTYDGDGTAGTIEVTTGGASIEVTIDGTSHADLSYPDGNNGINIQAYFDAGNTFEDLVAFIDSSDDFTCVIGDNMPPWIADDSKLKVYSAAAWTLTADLDLPAGELIAVKIPGVDNRTIISRGFKTYQTFGAGNTCYLDMFKYNSVEGADKIFRQPPATTVSLEKNNDEFRVDADTGDDMFILLDYSTAPNAADYIYINHSQLRR